VVNPGKLRVETYSLDGDFGRDSTWGRSGPTPADFVGCCNPVHIAQLPDGRFVTSEKGSPRVKVYSEAGEFECVVATPASFSDKAKNLDLAVDASGRIYVLDAVRKAVRIFERKAPENTESSESSIGAGVNRDQSGEDDG
jgi:Lon protease-like protein